MSNLSHKKQNFFLAKKIKQKSHLNNGIFLRSQSDNSFVANEKRQSLMALYKKICFGTVLIENTNRENFFIDPRDNNSKKSTNRMKKNARKYVVIKAH